MMRKFQCGEYFEDGEWETWCYWGKGCGEECNRWWHCGQSCDSENNNFFLIYLACSVGVSFDRLTLQCPWHWGLSGGEEKKWRIEDVLLKELGYAFSVCGMSWLF